MLDTAETYGPGRSERIIGETLPSLTDEVRAGLIVATKFTPIAPAEPIVAWQVAGSRRRLGMDALDLLYVHWKNPFVSARRVMQAMRPLVEEGLVRRAGVSNFTLDQWREAEAALRAPVVANQVQFSLAAPRPAEELVPYAAATGRVVVAYSPLGQGVLAGRSDFADTPGFGRPQARMARRRDGLDPLQVVIRRGRGGPRRHAGAGGARVGDLASQHDGDPRRPHDRAARGERGRRGPGALRGRAGPAHGGVEGLRGTVRVLGPGSAGSLARPRASSGATVWCPEIRAAPSRAVFAQGQRVDGRGPPTARLFDNRTVAPVHAG